MVCPQWLPAVVAYLLLFVCPDQSSASPLTLSLESAIPGNTGRPSSNKNASAVPLYVAHILLELPHTKSILEKATIAPCC